MVLSSVSPVPDYDDDTIMLGDFSPMQQIYERIQLIAKGREPIMITGESGTGKKLCTQTLRRLGAAHKAPFHVISCANPPGNFEHILKETVDETIYLSHLGDLPKRHQTLLLGCLDNIQSRVIAGGLPNLLQLVGLNYFRADLYHRLQANTLTMPPLRERATDIQTLAENFLVQFGLQYSRPALQLAPDALQLLSAYHWPGNVRQLQNVLRQVVIAHNSFLITAEMLPESIRSLRPDRNQRRFPATGDKKSIAPLWQTERLAIETAIQICDQNIQAAAECLQIAPSTIYRKRKEWLERDSVKE